MRLAALVIHGRTGAPHGVRLDHLAMVIDIDEAQARTVVQAVRLVLQGARALEVGAQRTTQAGTHGSAPRCSF